MNPLILIVIVLGGILVMKGGIGGGSGSTQNSGGSSQNPNITRSNPWNLPDIDSANQWGSYSTQYDESFEKASGATGVPFALIKAHAIRESSLNPSATHEDNSTESSYGLMQVEWSPVTVSSLYNRLSKYGDAYQGGNITPDLLEDPDTSAFLGASIIRDNLNWLSGNLRDAINAYNTGTTEAKNPAPANYVNDVISYYGTLIGGDPTC